MYPIPKNEAIASIIELNRDVESLVVQSSAKRSRFFYDSSEVLQFVHLADIHAVRELWARMTEYVNHYSDFISFAIHTGDFCGASQESYVDLYSQHPTCIRPILNCVGNHDHCQTNTDYTSPKEKVHKLLFSHTDNWDVCFMEGEASMTYYKDFPKSRVRLITLDCYYDLDTQEKWLRERLKEAKKLGYHVITASHEVTSPVVNKEKVTFQSIDDYESLQKGCNASYFPQFEDPIADFKEEGGVHICHLAGHDHFDMFGTTKRGVLNVAVECATNWNGWSDSLRLRGTKTYDCFNVMSVDTDLNLLKIVRVGDNADHYLRSKRCLTYDYAQKKVIFNT